MRRRYYNFFAIMRMATKTKKLHFSAPGNKLVLRILGLLRERGMIKGYGLEMKRKSFLEGYWSGYPKYKVYLKYNYYGYPLIKNFKCYRRTASSGHEFKINKGNYIKRIKSNNYYLIETLKGVKILSNKDWGREKNRGKILGKIQI